MRCDPDDNGGLFMGRRPGTAPVHYRSPPETGGSLRQRIDGHLADATFAALALVGVLCWGPIPLFCLWACAQVNYLTGSVTFGIITAFVLLFALLFGALQTMHDIDRVWILLRRAAGHDQRKGVMDRVFAVTAAIGAATFVLWFVVIHGAGSSDFSGQQVLHTELPQIKNLTVPVR
jgi:ABC-type multidrug transport system fused ATPase/permease subunit